MRLKRQQFFDALQSMSAICRSAVATTASRRTPLYRWDPALYRIVASRANTASTQDVVSALRLRSYGVAQSARPVVSEASKSLSPRGHMEIGRSRLAPSSSLSCGLRCAVVAAKALIRIHPSACGPQDRSPGRRSWSPVCIACTDSAEVPPLSAAVFQIDVYFFAVPSYGLLVHSGRMLTPFILRGMLSRSLMYLCALGAIVVELIGATSSQIQSRTPHVVRDHCSPPLLRVDKPANSGWMFRLWTSTFVRPRSASQVAATIWLQQDSSRASGLQSIASHQQEAVSFLVSCTAVGRSRL